MSYVITVVVIVLIVSILANINGYNSYIKSAYNYRGTPHLWADDRYYYGYNQVCRLDWETIKSIYQVCPGRWKKVGNNCGVWMLLYNGTNESFPGRLDYEWNQESTIGVIVPFKHWKNMEHYEKEYNKRKREDEASVSTQTLIQCAQSDIDRLQKMAQDQIDDANNRMNDIVKKGHLK